MGNRFQKVLIAQGSKIKSALPLGLGEQTAGHWDREQGRFSVALVSHLLDPSIHSLGAARERPVSPVDINLAAGHRSLLGETVGRVHLGNLGGGIPRSIVVALKRRCVWWGRRWGTDKELRLDREGRS